MTRNHSQIQHTRGGFHCGYLGCNKTFTRKTGARRHERLVHSDKKIFCQEPQCNYRGAKRRNDYNKHMREKHPGHNEHLFVPENFNDLRINEVPVTHSPASKYIISEFDDVATLKQNTISNDTRFDGRKESRNYFPTTRFETSRFYNNFVLPGVTTIPPRPPEPPSRIPQSISISGINLVPMAISPMYTTWGVSPMLGMPDSDLQNDTILEDEYTLLSSEYYAQFGQMGNDASTDYKW